MSNKKFINSYASRIIATLIALATIASMTFVATPALQAQVAIMDGDLISVDGNPDIYIVKLVGGKKFRRLILNPTIFDSYGHLRWDNVKTVSTSTLNSYTVSNLVREIYADGRLVDGRVFKLYPQGDTGVKRYVSLTQAQFEMVEDKDSIYAINHIEAGPTFYAMGEDLTATDYPQLSGGTTPSTGTGTTPSTGTGTGTGTGTQPGTPTGQPTAPGATAPTTSPGATTPPSGTTGDVTVTPGIPGTLDVSVRSQPNNTKVYPGEEEKVLTARLSAEDSAMTITQVQLRFKPGTSNRDPSRSFESVTLANGSTEYAVRSNFKSSDFTKENTKDWRLRITGLNITVPRGETLDLDVKVMVKDDIQSQYFQGWEVWLGDNALWARDSIPSYRWVENDTIRSFTVTQAKADLTVSLNDNSPESSVVITRVQDDTNTRADVLMFDIKNDGQADAFIQELKVKLQFSDSDDDAAESATNAANKYSNDLSDIVETLQLYNGSTLIEGTETDVPDDTSDEPNVRNTTNSWVVVTLTPDEEIAIDADSTLTLTVKADITPVSDGTTSNSDFTYREGTRVKAMLDSTTTFAATYEDGDAVAGADINNGSVVTVMGRKYELHKTALAYTLVGSNPAFQSQEGGSMQAIFTLDLTAQGGKVYVKEEGVACGTGDSDALFTLTLNSASNVGALVCDVPQFAGTYSKETINSNDWVVIEDGTTQRVSVSITVNKGSTAGYFDVSMDGMRWKTSTSGDTHSTTLSDVETVRGYIQSS